MSDSDSDLGPKPEPDIEPAEPNPGGADAVPEDDQNIPADLPVEKNPAVDDAQTPTLSEGEDTSTEATKGADPDDPEDTASAESAGSAEDPA